MNQITTTPAFVPPDVIRPDVPAMLQPVSMMNMIALAASDPNTDVAKLQALMAMQQQIVAEEARLQFNKALAAAQAEMVAVTRDAVNDHTRSRYARLETIDAKVRPIYTKHGFALSFNSEPIDGGCKITCEASHAGGHTKPFQIEGALDAVGAQGKANKTAIQALGSTTSYLRRYLTLMIFNITLTNEDDDATAGRHAVTRDEGRIDDMGGTTPAADPMIKWSDDAVDMFRKVKTEQALFKVIDRVQPNLPWLRENAPELANKVLAASKEAKGRIDALAEAADLAEKRFAS